MNTREIRDAVDELAQAPADVAMDDLRTKARRALTLIGRECERVQTQANNYPMNTIRGDVWMDGAMLGPLAAVLAENLKRHQMTEFEEQAHTLRCMAVLSVQSHYHHIVGPAMLARAECNERLGRVDFAATLYKAVIDDFLWILDEHNDEDEPLGDDDKLSLQCLQYALDRHAAIMPDEQTAAENSARARLVAMLGPYGGQGAA